MKFPNLIPSELVTMKFDGASKSRAEIINWIEAHFDPGTYSIITHQRTITFQNKEDALMFSLNFKCTDINIQVFSDA